MNRGTPSGRVHKWLWDVGLLSDVDTGRLMCYALLIATGTAIVVTLARSKRG